MDISDLRIALFSGNYNYVRDGANQALNRLVGWLLDNGADPTAENKLGKKAIYLARNYNKALEDTSALERLEQLAGE